MKYYLLLIPMMLFSGLLCYPVLCGFAWLCDCIAGETVYCTIFNVRILAASGIAWLIMPFLDDWIPS